MSTFTFKKLEEADLQMLFRWLSLPHVAQWWRETSDYLGKGYGQTIIKQFIDDIIMPMKPAKIIVDPEIINERAIHVYEKVGFKKKKIVETTDGTKMVTAQLMELDLNAI